MAYVWGASWIRNSARPYLRFADGGVGVIDGEIARRSNPNPDPETLVIPDIMYAHLPNERYGRTVSLSDKARAVIETVAPAVRLECHNLSWLDGTFAQKRWVIASVPSFDPTDEARSNYSLKFSSKTAYKMDEQIVLSSSLIGQHAIWRTPNLDEIMLFASNKCMEAMLEAELSGLWCEEWPEFDHCDPITPIPALSQFAYRVVSHFRPMASQALDGDLEAVRAIEQMPEGIIISSLNKHTTTWGVRVAPDNVPKKWYIGTSLRRLPPYFAAGYCFSVNEEIKNSIEALEPGSHQFFPLDFVNKKGAIIEKRYYLVIGNALDPLDQDASSPGASLFWISQLGERRRIRLSRKKIGSAHLWRNHHYSWTDNIFVSYELASILAMHDTKTLGFNRYRIA